MGHNWQGHKTIIAGLHYCLIVGKAQLVYICPPHLPLIFTGGGGQNMRKLASFETSPNFEQLAFENAARYPNSETKMQCCDYRPMSSPSLVKLGPRSHEKALSVLPHPIKLHGEKNVLNRRSLRRGSFDNALNGSATSNLA